MSKNWFTTGASGGFGAGTVKATLKIGDRAITTAKDAQIVRNALGEVVHVRLTAFAALSNSTNGSF